MHLQQEIHSSIEASEVFTEISLSLIHMSPDLSYMMEYSTCPGNDGQRIPNANCSWSHGGFDIGINLCIFIYKTLMYVYESRGIWE